MNTQSRHGNAHISISRLSALVTILTFMALIGNSFIEAARAQVRVGNVLIPASSIQHQKDLGVRAHTNIRILIGPPGGKDGYFGGAGPGGGLAPWQLRQAYNLPSTGGGQIIAIVDAFDNPNALGDFNVFAAQFGLPLETSSNPTASTNKVFQVVYATGTQPSPDSSGGWEFEESLDVQWAHAMAPNAKIVLVEANSNSNSDLYTAEQTATSFVDANGLVAKEISNSWGGGEYQGEQDNDIYFSGTSAVYFASAGDDAAPAGYPSASPYVISAGGTTVNTDANGNFVSESGWSDGGGGPSVVEPIPFFQTNIALIEANGGRGTPDLSFDADPNTGVSIYDTYLNDGWAVVGGTSVSSPSLAGIANLAGSANGDYPAGSQVLLAIIYNNLGSPNFRDITSGNNGYAAGPGWDFVTGVGSCLGLGGLTPIGTLIAHPQTVDVIPGTEPTITLTGSGPGNPTLTFAIAAQPINGTLSSFNAAAGTVTYTPNASFEGTDTFQFTVSTIDNTSAAATVTLIVAPGTPTANPQTVTVDLGTPTLITLTGSDPDVPPLPLEFAIATLPAHGTLSTHDTSTGMVTYTPRAGFKGTDSFTFAVDNGINHSALATVTLNVAAGKPTAIAQTVAVPHNTATKITLKGTDPDTPPLPLTYAISRSPAHGVVTGLNTATGAATYTSNPNYHGADSFTFTVSNGTYTSTAATVTLTVAPGTPTAIAQTVTVALSTKTTITLKGSDLDSPTMPLSFAIATGPTHGVLSALNASTGVVTYTPTAKYKGADSFTFTVSNGTNKSTPAAVTLNVGGG